MTYFCTFAVEVFAGLAELDGGQRVEVVLAAEVADLLHEDQVLRDVAD